MSEPRTIGYVRVSTAEQNPQMQIDALNGIGVPLNQIYQDVMSGTKVTRPGFQKAMRALHPGDTLAVWKLDRLGRNLKSVLETIEALEEGNINIRSVTEPIDTSTPMGRMIMRVLLTLAEMERDLISERTKEGVKSYKARGGRMGPRPFIESYPKRLECFRELLESGRLENMTGREIVEALNRADPKAPQITVPQTFYAWAKKGYPGLALSDDEPLETAAE